MNEFRFHLKFLFLIMIKEDVSLSKWRMSCFDSSRYDGKKREDDCNLPVLSEASASKWIQWLFLSVCCRRKNERPLHDPPPMEKSWSLIYGTPNH